MKTEYAAWIEAYLAKRNPLGMCQWAVERMVKAFPELTAVPGFVRVLHGGRPEHWWCTTPDGEVVDPTASQYEAVLEYIPWVPGMEVRVGCCMNCGMDIYKKPDKLGGPRESVCSQECHEELVLEYQ